MVRGSGQTAHISTTPAPPISDVSERNPTKQLAADLMLIDVSLREPGKDGGNVCGFGFQYGDVCGGDVLR